MDDQGASPLLTCPAEVLDLVLKSLSPANYAQLCSVNKSLQEFAEPYLYASVQWTWSRGPPPTPFVLFARSVLRRPQLGRHIRSLSLMGGSPYKIRENEAGDVSILEVERLSTGHLNKFFSTRGKSEKTWIDLLHAGSIDVLVTLLIAHFPNLTSLRLGPNFTKDNQCLGAMLLSALCDPVNHNLPRFEHLRTVNLNTGRCVNTARILRQLNAPSILSFFYLPSIECIRTSFDHVGPLTWTAPGGRAPVCCNSRELDLGVFFRAAYLEIVLSVAHNLKSLRWNWYHEGVTTPHKDDGLIDLDQVSAALSVVRESLTELVITAKCTRGANTQFTQPSCKGSLQLLANFPSMKTLQAPIAFLMGWSRDDPHWGLSDVVPKTIESLTIKDELWYHHQSYIWNEQAVLDVIRAWLADSERLPPNLRHFRLLLKNTLGLDQRLVSDEFEALGARAGVKVEIVRQRRGCSLKWLPNPA